MTAHLSGPRRAKPACVLLLTGLLAAAGCAPRSVPSSVPAPGASPEASSDAPPGAVSRVSPALPAVQVPPARVIPDTGVLSHEHEEREILPRATRVASSPLVTEKDDAPRVIRMPVVPRPSAPSAHETALSGLNGAADVYALSPYARLLARSESPQVFSSRRCGQHAGKERTAVRYAPRPAPAEWAKLAREAGEIFGLDAALVLAVIRAESAFNHAAESPAGAQGAMQIMPGTQVELGLIDPFDPRANIYAGSQYLMELMQRFGSVELALAAYNAGPASVEQYGGVPPFAETRDFVRRVMTYWEAGKERAGELLRRSSVLQ